MFIRRIINKINMIKRKSLLCIDNKSYKCVHFGNEYGGFDVCTDILPLPNSEKPIIVYSFGIGEDLSFSEDIMKKYNAEIWAYDPTPKSIEYVSHHFLSKNHQFHFDNVGLSYKCSTEKFHLPVNEKYVSGLIINHTGVKENGINVNMRSLDFLINTNNHDHIDILKLDIEGSEFSVIENFPVNLKINQICVEIHDRFFENSDRTLKEFLNNMKKLGYILISVSKSGEELTFIAAT